MNASHAMARLSSLFGLTLMAVVLVPTPLGAEVLALRGGTVHPVSGPTIENAVVVVEDGKITAVAPATAEATDTTVPAEAISIDFTGKDLYPGFIHPASVLGLIEIGSVRGPRDVGEIGDNNAHHRAEVAFNADSLLLPPTMAGGVLTAHVVPRGGVIGGTSALMRLDGWNWEGMTHTAPVGMHIEFPSPGRRSDASDEELEEQKEKALATLNETFDAARAYAKARRAATAGSGPAFDIDPRLEALIPVLDGNLPLYLWAREKDQIDVALEWAEEMEFGNIVLVAGQDAQYAAKDLAKADVPVILAGVLALPERQWEPYDSAYAAAARLHEAGVRFCIADSASAFGASNARNLPFHAAMAAAFGLPKDVALRSVTLSVAEILGVDDRLGSIDVGKDATFMITDGDPLEIMTQIERVWIEGREIDLSNHHQRRLYEKYRNRPRPEGIGASRLE